jgi:hypothetical protein
VLDVIAATLPGALSPLNPITRELNVDPVVVPVDGTTYSTTCNVFAHVPLVLSTPYALPSIDTVIISGALSVIVEQPDAVLRVFVKEKPVSNGAAWKSSMLYWMSE